MKRPSSFNNPRSIVTPVKWRDHGIYKKMIATAKKLWETCHARLQALIKVNRLFNGDESWTIIYLVQNLMQIHQGEHFKNEYII